MSWRIELAVAVAASPDRPVAVALIGPPGSGKSTLAVAARTLLGPRARILSLDAARARWSAWADEADQDATPAAIGALLAELRRGLSGDRVVIVDATHARAKDRRRLVAVARQRGASAIAVVLLPPIEVSLARNALRGARPGASGWLRRVPEDVVRTMHHTISDNLSRIPSEGWDLVLPAEPAPRRRRAPGGSCRTSSRIRGIRGRCPRVPRNRVVKPRHAGAGGGRR